MIIVEAFRGTSVTDHRVEVVERKGVGHPDYICDAVMESISIALSRAYRESVGAVLHHNIDKGLLAAGRTEVVFGGGRMTRPMELTIGDRASDAAGGKRVPVKEIAVGAAKEWIRTHLRFVDPERHVSFRSVLARGSEELTDIFVRPGKVRGANDTSALIGYYPLSPTEEAVLGLERHLNSRGFKQRHPDTGEDVKVMGLRTGYDLGMTVAMPLISGFISSEADYFRRKAEITSEIQRFLRRYNGFRHIALNVNTLDEKGRGRGGVYLSLLGTSAEGADSGQVGRGNRVNGLISMNRPMGTEAAAGKNPVSHVGKIYNLLAHKTAEKIYKNVDGVREVYVLLVSSIGSPIDSPRMAAAQVLLQKGWKISDISPRVKSILESELSGIGDFCRRIETGAYPVC